LCAEIIVEEDAFDAVIAGEDWEESATVASTPSWQPSPDDANELERLETELGSPDRAGARERREPLHCSFCGTSQYLVRKLIAGPADFICDACVRRLS
jgi:hypothetical protein